MTSRSDLHKDQFKRTEKQCKKAVRSAKKKFESNIAKNGNKRPFNAYIKSKTKSRDNVGPLKVGNSFNSDNALMASMLNDTFSAVFSTEDITTIPHCQSLSGNQSISHMIFTPATIAKKIRKMKVSSTSGLDGISTRFLSDNVSSMSVP